MEGTRRKGKKTRSLVRESAAEYRTTRRISSTEASRNFSELMNRVRYRGESFVIERGGEPICEIHPASVPRFTGADLAALLRSLPPVDEDYLNLIEELARAQPLVPESPWGR